MIHRIPKLVISLLLHMRTHSRKSASKHARTRTHMGTLVRIRVHALLQSVVDDTPGFYPFSHIHDWKTRLIDKVCDYLH